MILKEQDGKQVYSDGQEIEKSLLNIAENYPEDASQDYISSNSEYTINNTFSAVRQNLLNWYPFKKDADIIEVGAGAGALTGMLCNKARQVTAIEMSQARADIIRARYPHRENLQVISADITNWDTEQRFDYVVFVGVLEYAGAFSDVLNPYERFLDSCRRLLKKDGIVLFAIENRFGLKYWLGGAEDHLQKPFVGIDGYKGIRNAKTFSRHDLEAMLDNVGLLEHRIYSVYPDYKFPEIICTDEFKPSYMNLKKVHFTFGKNSMLTANETDLYKYLIENNVWEFFANSFLVEASEGELPENHVIHVSAKGECKKEYRVNTVIYSNGEILKVPVHRLAIRHIQQIYENNKLLKARGVHILDLDVKEGNLVSHFYKAPSAQSYFEELVADNNLPAIYTLVENWKKEILKSSDTIKDGNIVYELSNINPRLDYGPILKDGFIDMTFYNSFIEDGNLIFYDQEWKFPNVPLNFIVYYGLKSCFKRMQVLTNISLENILENFNIDREQQAVYDKLEDYVWSKILYRQTDFYGEDGYCMRYSDALRLEQQRMQEQDDYKNEIENLKKDILEKEDEIEKKEKMIKQKEEEIKQKDIQINNQRGHIELLLESDRHYQRILDSKGWKLVSFPGRVFERMFPVSTRRRTRLSLLSKYLKAINITNIKFVYGAFRQGGFRAINRELSEFDQRMRGAMVTPVEVPEIIKTGQIEDISQCRKLVFKKFEDPIVSIIIPVYNQFTYTYNCLKSIADHSGKVSYEIIIADDVSDDLTMRLSEVVENIHIIRNSTNMGFLCNCNNAAKYASGKYILFLNNDTQAQENWLQPLVDLIESDNTIGMVGSKLIYPDGSLQEAGGIIWRDGTAWNYGNGQNPDAPEFNYVKETDYISGASIMIKASVWEEIGGFDERYQPAYCEDSDLAFEVRKHGYKVMYQPLSVVVHFEGISNGTDESGGIKHYQQVNRNKFYDKWKNVLENEQDENGTNVFRAREKSQNRKILLMVDHYVPQYDKDAGSRTLYHYLKIFASKGYSIKLIGDNFFKHEPYTTVFQQMGIEVLYGVYYAQNWQNWVKANGREIDYIWLNRPHISIKYIDILKEYTDAKIMYYGMDLHFLRVQREYEVSHNKALIAESEEWKEKEFYLMKKADISYTPSEVEVDVVHQIDPDISMKAIKAFAYENFRDDIPENFRERKHIMFVGGFTHTPNEDAMLWFVKEVFPLILHRMDIMLYIVGSAPTSKIMDLKSKNVIVKGFLTDSELQNLYDTCKMVVVPLRYGAGVKGKVVEAMYNGLPVITTSIGAEGIIGIDDIVAIEDEKEGFADRVCSLYENPDELERLSMAEQKYMKDNFSTEAVWSIIQSDFN